MRQSPISLLWAFLLVTAPLGIRLTAQEKKEETPSKPEVSSIFVSETDPATRAVKETGHIPPPGPPMEGPDPDGGIPSVWQLKDGKKVKIQIVDWGWKPLPETEGKKRWHVVIKCIDTASEKYGSVAASSFAATETQRLLKLLWGRHNYTVKWRIETKAKEDAYTIEAAKWVDRIAAYTGEEPRKPGELSLPPLKSKRVSEAPDLRTFTGWKLKNKQGRTREGVGPVQILDWGMTDITDTFFTGASGIPVKIRIGDGSEEMAVASWLRMPDEDHLAVMLSFWKDWAKLRAAGGEVPGAEFKIKALTATLVPYWDRTSSDRENEPKVVAGNNAELSKAYRWGHALKFPGMPPEGFKAIEATAPERSAVPVLDQGPLGSRASDCLPSSIATFFLWWDEGSFLPLDQKGDLMKRADWLHSQLAREMRTLNNRGTQWSNVSKGLADFSKRFLGDRYAFQLSFDYDYSAANLARYMTGGHATVLSLTTWNGQRESGGHAVSLLSATPDGEVTIATWGMKLSGKWKEVDLPKGSKKPRQGVKPQPVLELEFTGLTDEQKKKLGNKRFILDSATYDGIAVITPFVREGAAEPAKKR